jgi:hypothetical protein
VTRSEVIFAEWMESIRKDVECTFGMLKERFRILKNKIQYHDIKIIEAIFKMCCILHNMILVYNGNFDDIISCAVWVLHSCTFHR